MEEKAFSMYENGNYKEACDLFIATRQSNAHQHSDRIIQGITIFFLVDIIGILFFLYIEKRKAYRLLVDKNTDCASRPIVNTATFQFDESELSADKDRQIMEGFQEMLEKERIFLDSDLTIEALASRLGTNRNVLSKLVNQHLGRSFPTIINQYRINEAVKMLTEPKTQNYTIEAVAQMCGFNNRQVFHSAFKKETGLTPNSFRNVAQAKD